MDNYRDYEYEALVLTEMRRLVDEGSLSKRDRILLSAAASHLNKMSLLHFADSEVLRNWSAYCFETEMEAFWGDTDREMWKKVYERLWYRFVRIVRNNARAGNCRKSVLVYDKEGNFVAEYRTIRAAAKAIGCFPTHISQVLSGKCRTVKGYVVRYKQEKEAE